jgi:hypothetical protein
MDQQTGLFELYRGDDPIVEYVDRFRMYSYLRLQALLLSMD